jgi:hypothetical protein
VRPVVVVLLPVADGDLGVGQGREQVDVEAFVAQATVEVLDEGLRHGSPEWDEQHPGPRASPLGQRSSDHLRPVVQPQHRRATTTTSGLDPVQFGGEHFAGDGALDQPAETFTGVLLWLTVQPSPRASR